jgi:hypothetical protein
MCSSTETITLHGPKPVIVTPTLNIIHPNPKSRSHVHHGGPSSSCSTPWSGSSSTSRCTLRTLVSFCVAIPISAMQLYDPTAVHPGKKYVPLRTRAHRDFLSKMNISSVRIAHRGLNPVIVTPTLYVFTPIQEFGRMSTTEAQVVHVQHQLSGSSSTSRCTLRTPVRFCVAIPISAVQLRDPTAVHPGKKYVPLRTRAHARFCFLPSNFGDFMRCHPYQRSAAARSHLQYTQGKSMSHHVPETMPDFVSSPRTSVSLSVVGELLPLPNNFHYLSKVCVGDTRVGWIMCKCQHHRCHVAALQPRPSMYNTKCYSCPTKYCKHTEITEDKQSALRKVIT